MSKLKKRLWLWNLVAVTTVIVCLLAFVMHYKNWTSTSPDEMKILSGFYYKKLKYSELDSVKLVDRIPPMERLTGFSVQEKGKGIYREYKDSLSDKKAYVFVDDFSHQKIAVTYQDSLKLYINLVDSAETQNMYRQLTDKMAQASD
ncbi:hypothetical protein RQM65_08405 [Pricia sp. S334]|uniref:Uncharacterized protein n=1 Tax=Pricia mediterranea TaxID=3076079 RepID=A0ABU3L4T4_9FLAO|nr:hypothetical protein [Pricia sp. S334]MDT7828682.1 hypothetical protein [Pricia sp. S334]